MITYTDLILHKFFIYNYCKRKEKKNKHIRKDWVLNYLPREINEERNNSWRRTLEDESLREKWWDELLQYISTLDINFQFNIDSLKETFKTPIFSQSSYFGSFFITEISYDNFNFNITIIPQQEYVLDKLKEKKYVPEGLENITSTLKEITLNREIKFCKLPFDVLKWYCSVVNNPKEKSILKNGISKENIFHTDKYSFSLDIVLHGIKYHIDLKNNYIGEYVFRNSGSSLHDYNFLDISYFGIFLQLNSEYSSLSRKEEEDPDSLNEKEKEKLAELRLIKRKNEVLKNISRILMDLNLAFEKYFNLDYEPIPNPDLRNKLDYINNFLSDYDLEIESFDELEEVVEKILARENNVNVVSKFNDMIETLGREDFKKYVTEVL